MTTKLEEMKQIAAAKALLPSLLTTQVVSVYSGKPDTCCCGCAGAHRYNSAHRTAAGKRRGYAIDDDEVNDMQVRRVLGFLKAADEPKLEDGLGDGRQHIFAEYNGRLYIAYLL